jgi:hypothetical protein
MPTLIVPFSGGYVSARDRNDLRPGELQTATGIYYKPGDPARAHKVGGRTEFADTSSAAKIKGLALCQFDSGGTDYLVALSGTTLYGATPGATGTFSSLATGLNSSATVMIAAHYDDRWYLANGYDRLDVLENSGTVRDAGMIGPVVRPTGAAGTGSAATYPTASTGSFTSAANAYDADTATYSHASRSTAGSTTHTWTTWSGDTAASRRLEVRYRLAGLPIGTEEREGGVGGRTDSGFKVTVLLEYSTDSGSNFSTLISETRTSAHTADQTAQIPVSVNSNLVHFKATLTYTSGAQQATLRIVEVKIQVGSSTSTFSTTTGIYYAFTEYDATRGNESPPSPESALITLTTQSQVTLTLPSSAQNSRATHWRIYRTPDGGTVPAQLGLIGAIPIAQTNYLDDFSRVAYNVQARPLIHYQSITVSDADGGVGRIQVPRDTPPPALSFITAWKGSLVGLRRDSPRALHYSEAGLPESWPEFNVITSFPLPERDELVALVPIGETLLIGAKGAMLTLTDLPRITQGVFNAAEAAPLRGAPGVVGPYAMTAFSVAGEPRAAWVSPFGVYWTNGQVVARMSEDLNWSSEVSVSSLGSAALYWDPERLVLILAYDSDGGGTNDRYFLFHMAPEHGKNGQPKITGPHYGAINCIAGGLVSATYRLYTGHVSDGSVYLEGGTSDASQAYSSTTVPLDVKTGRIYGDWQDWAAKRCNLRHTDFGSGQTATVTWTSGRDSSGLTQSVSKSPSLSGQQGTDMWIALGGEWHEIRVQHTGAASGALQDLRIEALPQSKAGRVLT